MPRGEADPVPLPIRPWISPSAPYLRIKSPTMNMSGSYRATALTSPAPGRPPRDSALPVPPAAGSPATESAKPHGGAGGGGRGPGEVAGLRVLPLGDVGTEVAQHAARGRRGVHGAEFQHPHPEQRPWRAGHRGSPFSTVAWACRSHSTALS